MAKKSDNPTLFEEIKAKEAELESMRQQVREELEGQLEHIVTQMQEFGLPFPRFLVDRLGAPLPPARKVREEKAPRVCKTCGKPGHNSRSCPLNKGQVDSEREPRLITEPTA